MEMFKSHLKTLPQMLVSPPRPLYQELAETNEIILTREVLQEKRLIVLMQSRVWMWTGTSINSLVCIKGAVFLKFRLVENNGKTSLHPDRHKDLFLIY